MATQTAMPSAPAAPADKLMKPTKPDEEAFKEAVRQAENEHKALMDKLNAVKEQIDLALPNKNKDQLSPSQQRRQDLIAQLDAIRTKQAGFKNARSNKLDQIKRLEEQIRSRLAEQKTARSKVSYKSLEDLDRAIDNLEARVNSGMLKIVEERKALDEISALRKLRRTFAAFDDGQKQIDELRAKVKALKDTPEDPEQKKLNEEYTKLQTELDALKAQSDEAYKSLSKLRDERSKLQAEQQEKYKEIRQIKDNFYSQMRAFKKYEQEARNKTRERQRAERERILKERKMAEAARMLEEASYPAFGEEIRRSIALLVFLDPENAPSLSTTQAKTSNDLSAQPLRKVDDEGIKGTKLMRKDERDDDYLPAIKKGKKGKKGKGSAATGTESTTKAYSCPPSVVQDCAYIGVDPPMSVVDVPGVVEKVKAKLEHWKTVQAEETKKNIEKAKKEIERLEKENSQVDDVAETLDKAAIRN